MKVLSFRNLVIMIMTCLPMFAFGNGNEMNGYDLADVSESKEFYIYNVATGLFLNDRNSCDSGMPALWTVKRNAEDGTWTIFADKKAVAVNLNIPTKSITLKVPFIGEQTLGGYSSATPDDVQVVTDAEEGSVFTITGTPNEYVITNKAEWKYFDFTKITIANIVSLIASGGTPASYTSYIYTGDAVDGSCTLLASENPVMPNAHWKFITPEDFENTEEYHSLVFATLKQTIAESESTIKNTNNSKLRKDIATVKLAKAKALVAIIETPSTNMSTKPSASEMLKAIAECKDAVAYAQTNSAYYTACKEGIENMSHLSSGLLVSGLVLAANNRLELCLSTTAMDAVMFTLRAGAILHAQTVKSWANGQDFTGFIGNHSFTTGDESKWLPLDLKQVAQFVPELNSFFETIGVDLNSTNVSVTDGQITANSSILQPLVALPKGRYRLSAQMATGKLDKAYLHATVINVVSLAEEIMAISQTVDISFSDAMQLALAIINGDPILDIIIQIGNVAEIDVESLFSLVLDAIDGNSKMIYTHGVNGKGLDEMLDNDLEFEVNGKDIVIIGASAQNTLIAGIGSIIPNNTVEGLEALLGASTYKADNFTLTFMTSTINEEFSEVVPSDEDSEGQETSITEVADKSEDTMIMHNVAGMRVNNDAKGIIIVNGKKIYR